MLEAAKITLAGSGLKVEATPAHPAGILYSGGYDANLNEVFLAGVMGHPGGVAAAGGNPSSENVSGLRVILISTDEAFWATDSMSLPRAINLEEAESVQRGLEIRFVGRHIQRINRLSDIST